MTVLMLGLTRKRGAVEEGEQVFAERTNVWQSDLVPPKFYSWLFTTRKGWFFKRRGRPIFQISRRDFITSILWFCWIFQWMLCRRLKRHVFVCQGHSRNFFFLSNSNETVKGYFKAGFLFLSHIGHVPLCRTCWKRSAAVEKQNGQGHIDTRGLCLSSSVCSHLHIHIPSLILLLLCFCDPMLYMLHSPKWQIDT